MARNWKTLECVCLLLSLLLFTGCSNEDEPDPAAQEIEQLKLQVAQANMLLQKVRAERDELDDVLSELMEKFAKVQSDFNTCVKERDSLRTKLNQISQTHDSTLQRAQEAQRTNEQLQKQLQEKMEEAQELQNYNRELNVSIERLQNQPEPEESQPPQE